MRLLRALAVILIAVSILSPRLHADIVITRDGMFLNGKILEDKKPDFIIFANNYGTFTIQYSLIKEIRRTENFMADIKIFRDMGKQLSEDEIKKNYMAGEKKLEERLDARMEEEPVSGGESAVLEFAAFCSVNSGKLAEVLPYSTGAALSGSFPADFLKSLYMHGIETEAAWFYSEKGERGFSGFTASAGPLWQIPSDLPGVGLRFNISALVGAGWFAVKNDDAGREASAIKWNISIHAGPRFNIGSVTLSAQLRLDYIHDGYAPLAGAGLSIGAGYAF